MRQLTNWISSYLEMVKETEPAQRFHLWTAITIIAAMLGRKCTVQLGPELFFPNLYTILVGPPGIRKGTAIKYGELLVEELGGAIAAPEVITKEALLGQFESVQEQVNINGNIFVHSSLFVIAPELVIFIKENDHERIGHLCRYYDGMSKLEYKTKTSGHNYIINPGLWILGATTPNWIEISMKQLGTGGGMTSRIIYVFADRKGQHIPATKLKPFDGQMKSKLVADLHSIKQMSGEFTFTETADAVFSDWYTGRHKKTKIQDDRFKGYWSRLPSMVIKVAMVLSASKRETMTVNDKDVLHAINMFEHIHPEMPLAFGALGYNIRGPQTELVRALLREEGEATRSYILHTLRMHISVLDYTSIKDTLLAERSITRRFCEVQGEEVLTWVKDSTELQMYQQESQQEEQEEQEEQTETGLSAPTEDI